MRPPSLIIDLDGTLVDSAPLIADIINRMLDARGVSRTVAATDTRAWLTQGGSQLVAALLGPDLVDLDADLADFRRRYAACATPDGCLFPGVRDGLQALSNLGVRMAICSNKPQSLCDKIVADLGLGQLFAAVVGSSDDLPLKPAPDLALRALDRLETTAADCLYIGDSDVDRQTAANAGITFLLVTYGYAEAGQTIDALARFDRFDQVAPYIAAAAPRRLMGTLDPRVAKAIRASEARIVIVGAGGWIGMATLDLLKAALGDRFAARVHAFGSNRRTLTLLDGTPVEQRPLADLALLPLDPTILLHLAFLTKDRAEDMDEAAYRAANRAIDGRVLAALDAIGTQAIFIASSGAAASANTAPAMQLYGGLKREQERRFSNWAERAKRRGVIARIFNLSGPYINKQASYAVGAFIRDALSGGPIRIRASHRVVRSYVAIRELMSLVFALLLDGSDDITRFDSGGEPMEMQEIAEAVAAQLGHVAIDRPAIDRAILDHYAGDGTEYSALLARHGIAPAAFARQVAETIDYLSFSGESGITARLANDRPA